MQVHGIWVAVLVLACAAGSATAEGRAGVLRAGVAKSDITTNVEGVRINDPLYAKALVLDDGTTRLAIVAMMPIHAYPRAMPMTAMTRTGIRLRMQPERHRYLVRIEDS